jgi:pimeloyl-ACP methyl ester carboxylesterase
MQLIQWQHQTRAGFSLRGLRSVPSGKPLLHLLHGNGFCSQMYWPMLSPLLQHVDLFLSDAQGHGLSEHGGTFVGWNQSATLACDALKAHLSEYKDVPVYAVGHSFGGVLTALLHSSPQSPFDAALLLDPVLFTPGMLRSMTALHWLGLYRHNPLARRAVKRRRHFTNQQTAWQYFHQRGMFRGWHPDALKAYIQHGLKESSEGLTLRCAPEREAEIFASFPRQLWSSLQRTTKPVQLIYGENSYPFVRKSAALFQRKCPQLQVQQVKGGHCFMQEDPQQSAALVLQWLQQQR